MKNLKILLGACLLAFLSGEVSAQSSTLNPDLNAVQKHLEQVESMQRDIIQFEELDNHRKNQYYSTSARSNDEPVRDRWIEATMQPDELTEEKVNSK